LRLKGDPKEGPVEITQATDADLDPILQLLVQQFEEHKIRIGLPLLEQAVTHLLCNELWGLCLVARKRDQVVGLAVVAFSWTLEHAGKTAWLDELYVRPEDRGQGVGTALIDGVVRKAEALGCRAIDLEVDQEHRRAERLYARLGFRHLARSRWVRPLGNQTG
jgi:GNAT superfamily N-acetyltransferase